MFLFILNLIVCGAALLITVLGNINSKRGTNITSRFARGAVTHSVNMLVYAISGAFIILDLICMLLFDSTLVNLSILLPIVCIVLAVCFMIKSTQDEQRKKDAREFTKSSLQVAEVSGGTIGAVVGTSVGDPVVGKAIGDSVGAIAGAAAKNMEETGIETEQLKKVVQNPETVQALMKRAERIGIETAGRSADEVADDVIKYSSPQQLAALPSSLSNTEKALKLLGQEDSV